MFKSTKFAMALGLMVVLSGCIIRVNADDSDGYHGGNIDRVMGGIDVGEGQTVEDLNSVNGGITLRDHSHAGKVETVNGGITIYDDVVVESVEATNGAIRAGDRFVANGNVSTVNGSITLRKGSTVDGDIKTVNGAISLQGTRSGRDVETVNGDIEITDNSTVAGDVVFKRVNHRYHNEGLPSLTVDASSTIKGTLYLYQPVDLHIADGAHVGSIVKRYDEE